MFNEVLKCVVKFAVDIIKRVDPQLTTMHPRLRNSRFYLYFKDCIGAIDRTHVPCVVPIISLFSTCAARAWLHKMSWLSVTSTWGLHLFLLAGLVLYMTWESSMMQQQHTSMSFHSHLQIKSYLTLHLFLVVELLVPEIFFAAVGKYCVVDSRYLTG
jgi:ABC-type transport system involved in cytochrome bd biosynthesis fused ATPase/permease subunit